MSTRPDQYETARRAGLALIEKCHRGLEQILLPEPQYMPIYHWAALSHDRSLRFMAQKMKRKQVSYTSQLLQTRGLWPKNYYMFFYIELQLCLLSEAVRSKPPVHGKNLQARNLS